MFVPNDPLYSRQWNFPQIDLERGWDINRGGSTSVTVAVLDTGVAFRSATLRYNGIAWRRDDGVAFPPWDRWTSRLPSRRISARTGSCRRAISSGTTTFRSTSPGTAPTWPGTIGRALEQRRERRGMAFNVKLMPVKVIDTEWDFIFNSPFIGTDDTVARGIRYAADNGAKVINMSLGARARRHRWCARRSSTRCRTAPSSPWRAATMRSRGTSAKRYGEFAPQIDGMVAVAATGPDRRRAGYSTTASYIELAAPGGDFSRGGATGGILQQTLDLDLVETFAGRCRATRRRDSTSSPTSTSKARRWRRATCRGWRRCS
jgi:serine protease